MSNSSSSSSGGVSILDLLFVLFVGLKLGGLIDWSWWWVTVPLWGGVAIIVVILAVVFLSVVIFEVIMEKF